MAFLTSFVSALGCMSIPGLLCSFLFQSFRSPGCSLCCLSSLEQWLLPAPSAFHPSRGKRVKSGEHLNRGESHSLWIWLVTPRKASFSSLKFQEMSYGLNCIMGLCRIGLYGGGGVGATSCSCWRCSAGSSGRESR